MGGKTLGGERKDTVVDNCDGGAGGTKDCWI